MAYKACRYCGKQDQSELIMSTRVVNGRVKNIDVCLNCFWRDEFVHEAEGEDGNILSEQAYGRDDSEREIFKRFKCPSSSVGQEVY